MASNVLLVVRQWIESVPHLVSQSFRPVLYGGTVACLLILFVVTRSIQRKKLALPRAKSFDLEKPSSRKPTLTGRERTPGVWTPVDFKRPDPPPYPDWDVYRTDPLPYRPFRHGPYHITMGLRTMQWDDWIELDNHYLKFHADKTRRIEERGATHCRTAPEAMDGAIELLEEL